MSGFSLMSLEYEGENPEHVQVAQDLSNAGSLEHFLALMGQIVDSAARVASVVSL